MPNEPRSRCWWRFLTEVQPDQSLDAETQRELFNEWLCGEVANFGRPAAGDRDLVADLALCEAAAPGPWSVGPQHRESEGKSWLYYSYQRAINSSEGDIAVCDDDDLMAKNAPMIAASREGWPAAIREVMRLRAAIVKFLGATGHDLCFENRLDLAAAIGIEPSRPSLPEEQDFARRCIQYRLELYGHDGPGSKTEVWEAEVAKITADRDRLRVALLRLTYPSRTCVKCGRAKGDAHREDCELGQALGGES